MQLRRTLHCSHLITPQNCTSPVANWLGDWRLGCGEQELVMLEVNGEEVVHWSPKSRWGLGRWAVSTCISGRWQTMSPKASVLRLAPWASPSRVVGMGFSPTNWLTDQLSYVRGWLFKSSILFHEFFKRPRRDSTQIFYYFRHVIFI